MVVLLTGGAGYIGSHTYIELMQNGHDVVIIDNFSNSKKEQISKLEQMTNQKVFFYEELGWKATGTLEDMCKSTYRYYIDKLTNQ